MRYKKSPVSSQCRLLPGTVAGKVPVVVVVVMAE